MIYYNDIKYIINIDIVLVISFILLISSINFRRKRITSIDEIKTTYNKGNTWIPTIKFILLHALFKFALFLGSTVKTIEVENL